MIKKTALVLAYYVDFSYGSEPTIGMHILTESLKKYEKIVLVTSNMTKLETLSQLKLKYMGQLDIHVVRVFSTSIINHSGLFYPLYRNWQKRVGRLLSGETIEYDLGFHATLGTFLFGTGLCYGGKPYIYGPAGFSFFRLKYLRVIGMRSIKELLRNFTILSILILDPFVRKSLRLSTVSIGTDDSVLRYLQLTRNAKTLYAEPIPHAIVPDETFAGRTGDRRRNKIIWVGRFISRKDPIFALQVFLHLLKVYPELELTFAGEGKLEKKMIKFIHENSLENKVKIVGWIPKNEVMSLMSEAEYMFFTSYRESAGFQIFECTSVGTKVIALDATGASSWYENPMVQFVGPSFGQSRDKLVKRFCEIYESNHDSTKQKKDSTSVHSKDSEVDFSPRSLMERIINTLPSAER